MLPTTFLISQVFNFFIASYMRLVGCGWRRLRKLVNIRRLHACGWGEWMSRRNCNYYYRILTLTLSFTTISKWCLVLALPCFVYTTFKSIFHSFCRQIVQRHQRWAHHGQHWHGHCHRCSHHNCTLLYRPRKMPKASRILCNSIMLQQHEQSVTGTVFVHILLANCSRKYSTFYIFFFIFCCFTYRWHARLHVRTCGVELNCKLRIDIDICDEYSVELSPTKFKSHAAPTHPFYAWIIVWEMSCIYPYDLRVGGGIAQSSWSDK